MLGSVGEGLTVRPGDITALPGRTPAGQGPPKSEALGKQIMQAYPWGRD